MSALSDVEHSLHLELLKQEQAQMLEERIDALWPEATREWIRTMEIGDYQEAIGEMSEENKQEFMCALLHNNPSKMVGVMNHVIIYSEPMIRKIAERHIEDE